MASFNPYQFKNSHYSPDYSQYGDALFSTFSSQMFSQDSQPSFDRAFEHGQPIQPSSVPSAASGGTKESNERGRWGFDFGLTILKKLKAKIAAKPEKKSARRCMRDKA